MKVQTITAYKSQDDEIWEKEGDAIHSNIQDLIIDNLNHNCDTSDTDIHKDIVLWFRDFPADIKYIQANIKKLLPHHFGEE